MEKIIHGDCLEVLKEMPDNSVDAVVTDPPYGLSKEPDIYEVLTKWMNGEDYHHRGGGFMNKSWDSFVPGPSVWKEVYRVLKPGGHALVFASTRTQDLMGISLRMAGFEIRDCIAYLFFSGFPKSLDISKALDKTVVKRKLFEPFAKHFKEQREKKGLSTKDVAKYFPSKNGNLTGCVWNWENAMNVPTLEQWKILKPLLDLSDEFLPLIERVEAEREKIGEGNAGLAKGESRKNGSHKVGYKEKYDITAPATELAKKWDGWGTALKPAHEPIILCRKPLEKNVAYNVEKWGTGGLNIDGCRIPTDEDTSRPNGKTAIWDKTVTMKAGIGGGHEKGRFPANCVTLEEDAFFSKYFNITPPELSKKASKKDRNSDWKGEEIQIESMQPVRFASENGSGKMFPNKSKGIESHVVKGNFHPTVKPTALMAWLIKLITPPGGIVLDPFAGSGSTLVAAKREGFSFIGIELEPEYYEIAKARIGA